MVKCRDLSVAVQHGRIVVRDRVKMKVRVPFSIMLNRITTVKVRTRFQDWGEQFMPNY